MDKNVYCPSCGKAMTWTVHQIEFGHFEGYYGGRFRCDNEECIAGWKTSMILGTSEEDAHETAIENANLRVNVQNLPQSPLATAPSTEGAYKTEEERRGLGG